MCKIQRNDPTTAGKLQDDVMKSEDFQKIVNHDSFLKLAASSLKTTEDDVKMVFPFFRIDLPAEFIEDKKSFITLASGV